VVRQLEELNAFHERTKKLLNSPESALNIEYLKRCVYRLMVTKELSERRSLYPVISVILKFTPQEAANVSQTMEEELADAAGDSSWTRLATNSFGSFFGNS
jgi:UDP-N-acetylenolpyruvoylglucosamine reductase